MNTTGVTTNLRSSQFVSDDEVQAIIKAVMGNRPSGVKEDLMVDRAMMVASEIAISRELLHLFDRLLEGELDLQFDDNGWRFVPLAPAR